ncbi:MAG: hypothetical protein ACP5PJ_04380 [Acidimicrobiales bacterium]
MTEPRRVLIDWDYAAEGIWWCLTAKERLAARGSLPNSSPGVPRLVAWPELLPEPLLADLVRWNRTCESEAATSTSLSTELENEAIRLAERVREALGDDERWEVLFKSGSEIVRVDPPGRWSVWTWEEELLGYPPKQRPGL